MSLMSTNATSGLDETPHMMSIDQESKFSVTKNDTPQTTLEKLRQRSALLSQRRQASIREYEASERRKQALMQSCQEAEASCKKLQDKITYYKSSLQEQIQQGLKEQEERSVDLKQKLDIGKYRFQELEEQRNRALKNCNTQTNIVENQIQNQAIQKDQLTKNVSNNLQQVDELIKTRQQLTEQLQHQLEINQQVKQQFQNIVLKSAHSSDENYEGYIQQILQAKQLTHGNNINTDIQTKILQMSQLNPTMLTQLNTFNAINQQLFQQDQQNNMTDSQKNETFTNFLVNKCEYGNEWQKELTRPKKEQNVQVSTTTKNMNASITIFDEETGDNYTFSQQVQPNTPVIKHKQRGYETSSTSSYYKQSYGSNPYYEFEERTPISTNQKTKTTGKGKISKNVQFKQQNYTHQPSQTNTVSRKTALRQNSAGALQQRTQDRTLATPARMDIILGLKEKIKQLTDQKKGLERRLAAVNKSYQPSNDKQERINMIREEITSKMFSIANLKKRLKSIENKQ